MKYHNFFILSVVFFSVLQAQSITPEMLRNFRDAQAKMTPKATINAVSNHTNLRDLALNTAQPGSIDPYFAVKLDIKGITDQNKTGRCWLFTSMNVIRQKVREKLNLSEFEFSENFSFFYDQLEKANLCLEGIIETRDRSMDDRTVHWLFSNALGDGGVWNMMVDIVEKYGLVPKEVMPDTKHGGETGTMRRIVRRKIRESAIRLRQMHEDGQSLEDLRKSKESMLSDIYRLLAIHLGEPPSEFQWRYKDKDDKISSYKSYTPLSFFQEMVDVNLRDYIMLMNDPTREYNKLYEIDRDRNMQEGDNWKYINLAANELKSFAKASLLSGEAMYFSCDVGKYLDRDAGYLDLDLYDYESLYGMEFPMNKAERILTLESASSHGMALVGFDTLSDGSTSKWLLENSWGASSGHDGYLIMTDAWFDEYAFRLVVHKRFLDTKVLKILKQKPVMLPPWDYMY